MEGEGGKKLRGRTRGRARGRARGRTRGRTKKAVKMIESDDEDIPQADENETTNNSVNTIETPEAPQQQPEQQFDLEADISQLEAPTFTTINRGPPEPMLRLRWDHRVNLIGEKVLNPMIHCCDKCLKPILIYGRMIPCKHVFCLSCAKREEKICPRCKEKVSRVEQTGLGTVFMCTHGGTRYGNAGCRRTYLSQRDLQAHINHRHVTAPPQPVQGLPVDSSQYVTHSKPDVDSQMSKVSSVTVQSNRMKVQSQIVQPIMGNDPRVSSLANQAEHRQQLRPQQMISMQNYPQSSTAQLANNQALRTNLITVPIQDTSVGQHEIQSHHTYPPPPQVSYGAYYVPPQVSQTQQYFQQQQVPFVATTQQPSYVTSSPSLRPSPANYIQDAQYGTPAQQQQQPPSSQWSQHQQQFYR